MEFMRSRPDIVRSESQRWLLAHWDALRPPDDLPAWQGLQPEALGVPADHLSFLEVVASNGGARFQIKFHGAGIAALYGRTSCIGKFLDEILPPSSREATLSTYRHVVGHRLPVYTVSDTRDSSGCIVHYERLLLPFGADEGRGVARILASLETVSPEGAFESHGLMTARPPSFALCTTIQC